MLQVFEPEKVRKRKGIGGMKKFFKPEKVRVTNIA
jgi:hypothetical protein